MHAGSELRECVKRACALNADALQKSRCKPKGNYAKHAARHTANRCSRY